MFENALWRSRSHAKQPLWFVMAPMIFFFVAIPFCIHFWGIGLVFGIDVALAILSLFVIMIIGRKFKWNNSKLLFAVTHEGIFFTNVSANNGSYFHESFHNVRGYSYVADGNYVTVTVYFHQTTNAGIFGNLNSVKMIKIENFERLQEVFASHEVMLVSD